MDAKEQLLDFLRQALNVIDGVDDLKDLIDQITIATQQARAQVAADQAEYFMTVTKELLDGLVSEIDKPQFPILDMY